MVETSKIGYNGDLPFPPKPDDPTPKELEIYESQVEAVRNHLSEIMGIQVDEPVESDSPPPPPAPAPATIFDPALNPLFQQLQSIQLQLQQFQEQAQAQQAQGKKRPASEPTSPKEDKPAKKKQKKQKKDRSDDDEDK